MKFKNEVSEDEVYSHWFVHEVNGLRHSQILALILTNSQLDLDVLENLGDDDKSKVEKRAQALRIWRGPIVNKLPSNTIWNLVEINQEDFKALTILKDPSWLPLSKNNSYKLSVIGDTIYSRKEHWLETEHSEAVEHIFKMVEAVDQLDKRLILICHDKRGPYTIIDGVNRAIALYVYHFIVSQKKLRSFDVFFGLVPEKNYWQPNDC